MPLIWKGKDVSHIMNHHNVPSEYFEQEYDDDIISEDDNKFLMGISYTDLKKMTVDDLKQKFPIKIVDEMVMILKENKVVLKKEESNTTFTDLDVALGGF